MIRGSDGLDYEDLAARLLGEPAKTSRNDILRPDSPYSRLFKAAYSEAWDRHEAQGCSTLECHRGAYAQACISASNAAANAAAGWNDFGVIATRPHAYL